MKNNYIEPNMEIIDLCNVDIITTSNGDEDILSPPAGGDDGQAEWMPGQ